MSVLRSQSAAPASAPANQTSWPLEATPVIHGEQNRHLRSRQPKKTFRYRRPANAPLIRPPGHQNLPAAVVVQYFHTTRPPQPEHQNQSRIRLNPQILPRLAAQRSDPSTEVNRPQGQTNTRNFPNPQHPSLQTTIHTSEDGDPPPPPAVEAGDQIVAYPSSAMPRVSRA